jgi:precorrin-4/cobalt-precorrin-4 C11-methyltransferase
MTERHPVIFVGAGPGDPELITLKGQKALAAADLVLYAGSLVSPAILTWTIPGVELVDTAALNLKEIVGRIMEGFRSGKRVVRVHSGDPALFGAIQEQLEILEQEEIPCSVIPGVTAAFAAAAALAQELTLPEVTQTLILTRAAGRTPVPEREALRGLAQHGATLVIYLSIKLIDAVVADLIPAYGAETPVVVAYRVSWPDQRLIRGTLATIAGLVKESRIERQALILVGPALAAREGQPKTRSRLYDGSFSHGFRNGGTITNEKDTEAIRQSFRPDKIRLLVIGESPPVSGRFFYIKGAMTTLTSRAFERAHGIIFHNNLEFLEYFKASGCFLDDLSHSPVNQLNRTEREEKLRKNIDALGERIAEANPDVVVAALKKIGHYVREAVEKSQCSPQLYVVPFPGNGRQNEYIEKMAKIIDEHVPALVRVSE